VIVCCELFINIQKWHQEEEERLLKFAESQLSNPISQAQKWGVALPEDMGLVASWSLQNLTFPYHTIWSKM